MEKAVSMILLILLLVGLFAIAFSAASVVATSQVKPRHFRLLAVEGKFDGYYMQSAQFLIRSLLQYQNWGNSTEEYVSYIHLLSMYSREDVDPLVKPCWRGVTAKYNIKCEIENFLAQAEPGEIVIFYYCGHGDFIKLLLDQTIYDTELVSWLGSGGLPQAYVTVILDTCQSGSWIEDGEGGVLGPNRTVLASCLSGQISWGFECGWFTYFGIIDGFSLANDANSDGWISAAEVFAYAKPATESSANEFGKKQNPVSYYGQFEGDIPLIQRDVTTPFPMWDLAITSFSWEPLHEFTLSINVTVRNQGEKGGVFDVAVYANAILIDTQNVSLNPDENVTLMFIWDVANVSVGTYVMSSTVTVAPGEINIEDNVFIDGVVKIGCGDMNGDFKVDIYDLIIASLAYGSKEGDPNWNPLADLAPRYGIIDIYDLVTCAYHYGTEI